jgi:hypothetical protein
MRARHVVAAALAATALIPTTAAAATGPAPVAHWAFDEGSGTTAADSAGGHTATLVGGATWGQPIKGASALATNGTSVKKRMIAGAGRRIVPADGSKIGRVELAHLCPIDQVDLVPTGKSADAVAALRERGCDVRIVD